MNTYIIIGAMVLSGALPAMYLLHRISSAKDYSYSIGYSAGAESQQGTIAALQRQIDNQTVDLLKLRAARDRERIEAHEALEQAVHDADQRIADTERRALSADDATTLRAFATQLEVAATTCRNVGATVAADNMKRGAAIARTLADKASAPTEVVQEAAA
ncbi:hypothetical protein ACFOJE_01550 [Azotobacter bryophylli]|uniref:DUF2514 domain-containing protein n=1 Tax=Azotobacter bryophylli TaxID=1986537 RepID=A0ABV7APV2_9GAMM